MIKLRKIIDIVRADPTAMDDYGYLSTSEWLVVLLGVGEPWSISRLDQTAFPSIPEAWQRIGSSGQQIVLDAWAEV